MKASRSILAWIQTESHPDGPGDVGNVAVVSAVGGKKKEDWTALEGKGSDSNLPRRANPVEHFNQWHAVEGLERRQS